MKPRFTAFTLLLLVSGCIGQPRAATPVHVFATEAAAHAYCPTGTIVWVDNIAGVYHMKGDPWYGRVFDNGGYACKSEADRSPYMRPGHKIND